MEEDIKVIFDDEEDIGVTLDTGSLQIQYGTLEIGETITGEAGTEAKVTNSGSSSSAILNFTIPTGDSGVYIGAEAPTNGAKVWIDTDESPTDEYVTRAELEELLGVIENGSY